MTVLVAGLVSTLHIGAIAALVCATFVRGMALRGPLDPPGLRRLFMADNVSGIAAMLILGSGLWRALGGAERGWDFYKFNGLFWVKVGLFALVFTLELVPMTNLIRWRIQLGRGQTPDFRRAALMARVNTLELVGMGLLLWIAPLMARGAWLLES